MHESSHVITCVHKHVIHFFSICFGVFFQASFLLIMSSPALQMSVTPYVSFVDGAFRSTHNLSSTTWAIYDPHGGLIDLKGIFLGQTTNNIAKYSAVFELLLEAIALDIREMVVSGQEVTLQSRKN